MEKIHLTDNSWYQIKENFIETTKEEFDELWSLHPEKRHQFKMFGKLCTMWRYQDLYSDKDRVYKFSNTKHDSKKIEDPILRRALTQIQDLTKNEDDAPEYNSIYVNWYEPNDYIGPHKDNEKGLNKGAPIYSISLGETRTFRIINEADKSKTSIELNDGSLIVMGGDFQKEFKHEVPKGPYKGKRINLTVRSFL